MIDPSGGITFPAAVRLENGRKQRFEVTFLNGEEPNWQLADAVLRQSWSTIKTVAVQVWENPNK